jgi:hypothetical protein
MTGEYTCRRSRVGDSPPRRRKQHSYLLMLRREGKHRDASWSDAGDEERLMKGPRIAIRGFAIESNRFAPVMTSEFCAGDDVRNSCIRTMDAILWTPVPNLFANAESGSPVEHAFFAGTMRDFEQRFVRGSDSPVGTRWSSRFRRTRKIGLFTNKGSLRCEIMPG